VQEELQEMMIGRADERVNPGRATAGRGRLIVVVSFAEPIWASGHRAALRAEHMIAVAPPMKSSSKTLHSRGRPHMRVGACIIARHYTYDDIVDHCADAWNKLAARPWTIMSIGMRDWPNVY